MENQRSGLVRCAANSMTFATVKRLPLAGSFAIFRSPAMPGMLRKSTAFVPRYQEFESISLQRRVCELSVPERELAAIDAHLAAEAAADISGRAPSFLETTAGPSYRTRGTEADASSREPLSRV